MHHSPTAKPYCSVSTLTKSGYHQLLIEVLDLAVEGTTVSMLSTNSSLQASITWNHSVARGQLRQHLHLRQQGQQLGLQTALAHLPLPHKHPKLLLKCHQHAAALFQSLPHVQERRNSDS